MGTYVEGSIWVAFSRELTETEDAVWQENGKAGRPGLGACSNRDHQGALLDPKTGTCEHFRAKVGTYGEEGFEQGSYCYSDSDRYDPEGWCFDDSIWGDVGQAELSTNGFTISTGGKVYDVTDACAWFVECLPADVTARGFGRFESDSEPWGLLVNERTVIEIDVYDISGPVYAGLVKLAANRPSFSALDRDSWAILSTVLDLFSIENPEAVAHEQKRQEAER